VWPDEQHLEGGPTAQRLNDFSFKVEVAPGQEVGGRLISDQKVRAPINCFTSASALALSKP
jgi:hypothetical protein